MRAPRRRAGSRSRRLGGAHGDHEGNAPLQPALHLLPQLAGGPEPDDDVPGPGARDPGCAARSVACASSTSSGTGARRRSSRTPSTARPSGCRQRFRRPGPERAEHGADERHPPDGRVARARPRARLQRRRQPRRAARDPRRASRRRARAADVGTSAAGDRTAAGRRDHPVGHAARGRRGDPRGRGGARARVPARARRPGASRS